MPPDLLLLSGLVFAVAALYSSVGHGGASGYLAVMALAGVAPAIMRPSGLALNLLVSAIATVQFHRAGHFSWRLFWPFAIASVPCALVGGLIALPDPVYRRLLGAVLLFAAWRLAFVDPSGESDLRGHPPRRVALAVGGAIGLLSGMTGVGGGIFLTPLLVLERWAGARAAAATSAPFILVNSMAGLVGQIPAARGLPASVAAWAAAAVLGGLLGSTWGSRQLGGIALRRLLAVVLVVAAAKMLLT